MTFAKGFTSSVLPMSGVAVSSSIHEYFQQNVLGYGSTYQCHPVSAACAYSTIKYIENQEIIKTVSMNETYLRGKMEKLSRFPIFADFRLYGYFGCFDLICPKKEKLKKDSEISNYFQEQLFENKLISMYRVPHFHIAPALIATIEDIDECFSRIEKATIATVDKYFS